MPFLIKSLRKRPIHPERKIALAFRFGLQFGTSRRLDCSDGVCRLRGSYGTSYYAWPVPAAPCELVRKCYNLPQQQRSVQELPIAGDLGVARLWIHHHHLPAVIAAATAAATATTPVSETPISSPVSASEDSHHHRRAVQSHSIRPVPCARPRIRGLPAPVDRLVAQRATVCRRPAKAMRVRVPPTRWGEVLQPLRLTVTLTVTRGGHVFACERRCTRVQYV